ncbi:DUF4082 domain-containing protein [Luteolibacter yonseiensis]|uniref:DUF4082 domain-containing protein n=1 Tax=Luteolibacter yonseiensis TaxID=1144680 RepID=A0A934R5T9_9BACT|nr:DUF4082 domain-containing protein [Luteolibacter yonseiensis]MBK1816781.1 DUF4082 domain-containing protein [Luteolibacter yonseiensis]
MKKSILITTLASLVIASSASAAVTAFSLPTPVSTYSNAGNAQYVLGYTFTVGSNPLTVTDLGFFDAGGNGLGTAHPVTIWNSGGTVVGTATVSSGTTGTLEGGYRYTTVPEPITLSANTTYTIGATMYTNMDVSPANQSIAAATAAAGITLGSARSNMTGVFPTGDPNGLGHYLTANFKFNAVPEPGVALLAGIAAIPFLRRRR